MTGDKSLLPEAFGAAPIAAGPPWHDARSVAAPIPPRTTLEKWRYALKPASWAKLTAPAALGQALGVAHRGGVDLMGIVVGMGLTALMLAFIVLLNDWGDREVDAIKRRMFPQGCSPKTIPDGILPAPSLLAVGLGAGVLASALAFASEEWLARPLLGEATLVCLGLFVAYTLPPLRLNYRGGGELLEAIGCGFALPWLNAYVQAGLGAASLTWMPRPAALLPGVVLLALASAIASGLSDEVSDRKGGKRTFTTALGNPLARRLTELCVLLGLGAWGLAALVSEHVPLLVVVIAAPGVLLQWRQVRALSTSAVTNAFPAQARYKQHLHQAIWGGFRTLGGALVLHRVFLA